MRDIKFRAWDTVTQSYDENHHLRLDMNGVAYNLQTGAGGNEYVLELFTGLKDKKRTEEYPEGQKIYEGDILKLKTNPVFHCGYYDASDYEVRFNQGTWDMHSERIVNTERLYGCNTDSLEIIGNIHKNPELLKD